jgi:hypothetical protein
VDKFKVGNRVVYKPNRGWVGTVIEAAVETGVKNSYFSTITIKWDNGKVKKYQHNLGNFEVGQSFKVGDRVSHKIYDNGCGIVDFVDYKKDRIGVVWDHGNTNGNTSNCSSTDLTLLVPIIEDKETNVVKQETEDPNKGRLQMKTDKLKADVLKGVKIGASTGLSRQLVSTVKTALGEQYPKVLSQEPWASAEPFMILGALSMFSEHLPEKVRVAVGLALQGEAAQFVTTHLSGDKISTLMSSLAAVAALHVKEQ